jgi:hypothetical protein
MSRDGYPACPLTRWLLRAENTRHVTATHCCGDIIALVLVFTKPLPRNGFHKLVVLLLRVGPCVFCGRCLKMNLHVTISVPVGTQMRRSSFRRVPSTDSLLSRECFSRAAIAVSCPVGESCFKHFRCIIWGTILGISFSFFVNFHSGVKCGHWKPQSQWQFDTCIRRMHQLVL